MRDDTKILLICGVASSALYVASDISISWWDPNYGYRDRSFSELLAPESPTRPLMLALNAIPYGVLVTAFGVGVGISRSKARRSHHRSPARRELRAQERASCGAPPATDTISVPGAYVERLAEAVCYAARMAGVELWVVVG